MNFLASLVFIFQTFSREKATSLQRQQKAYYVLICSSIRISFEEIIYKNKPYNEDLQPN